jgi:hypothetical protein
MRKKLDVMQIGESVIKGIRCEFDGGFVNTTFQPRRWELPSS